MRVYYFYWAASRPWRSFILCILQPFFIFSVLISFRTASCLYLKGYVLHDPQLTVPHSTVSIFITSLNSLSCVFCLCNIFITLFEIPFASSLSVSLHLFANASIFSFVNSVMSHFVDIFISVFCTLCFSHFLYTLSFLYQVFNSVIPRLTRNLLFYIVYCFH